LYDRATIPLPYPKPPTNVPDIALVNWLELRTFSGIPDAGPCSDDTTRELIHAYYACMSFVDAQVGRILAELDRLDLRKDTIIVLWSDHGVKLGEHGMWSKHTNFEPDTHVPLIIADPDYAAGLRTRALAESVDLYPTLAELCGLPPVEGLEGTSLLPLMVDPTRPWKSAAFSQYPRPGNIMGYSMRTDRYRYNEWVDRATREVKARELYDMMNDPECRVNLAPNADQAALIVQLHGQLTAGWQAARP
jgi:arylsulfatase A-like enzyme